LEEQSDDMEAHPFETDVVLPLALSRLRELALNLRWTWDRETRALFREIYPDLWDRIVDNPWLVLRAASPARLATLAADPEFCARVERAHAGLLAYMAERGWFHQAHADEEEASIAYFTAEVGLTECLPIYAGGLGVLSGDHVKAASALGVPLVGVSLLYHEGYNRQMLDANGWQMDRYPPNAVELMPLRLERDADGWPLLVRVALPGRNVILSVWRAQVGRIPIYLLDSNVPTNSPVDRGITAQLYGGDREMRLQQEMVLGIAGWRALTAVGHRPEVCHLNEGHAAFAVFERARQLHQDTGVSFWEALAATAAGNVFTTHTPVPAGFDLFPPDMFIRYFGAYAEELGISASDLAGLGRVEPLNWDEPFNMAVLALRHVNSCNGVSKLHAVVSRRVFGPEFPRFPAEEIPITAVTNGIHTDSWLSEGMGRLLKQYVGESVDEQPDQADWERVNTIPDAEIWAALAEGRQRLVTFARGRLRRQLGQRGIPAIEARARAEVALDPNILTIGFARRFATYKRATLFMRDRDRLRRLLLHPLRPIQFVIAGKAHPNDDGGKALIQEVFRFAEEADVRHRIVFLEDYDMRVTGRMVQGVDVWLNTPRRPMEASGTSGMKVLPNGGLNFSVRDGWWAEAYPPEAKSDGALPVSLPVGWAIGEDWEDPDPGHQDAVDAAQLYDLLEREIIPLYYNRDRDGVPHGWVARVKQSMRLLCPVFNTNRMVRQYVDEHYLPAARRYRAMTANRMAEAKSLAAWKAQVRWHWERIRIEESAAQARDGVITFRARVSFGPLHPEDLSVQAYAEPISNNGTQSSAEVVTLEPRRAESGGALYEGRVRTRRPAEHFTIRVVPQHPNARQPLDVPLVRWGEKR
jgi:starch phosphorylase